MRGIPFWKHQSSSAIDIGTPPYDTVLISCSNFNAMGSFFAAWICGASHVPKVVIRFNPHTLTKVNNSSVENRIFEGWTMYDLVYKHPRYSRLERM